MHLAILVTNTDHSPFAARHPRDGEKFTRLIQMARPDWQATPLQIQAGEMPPDPSAFMAKFDGAIITGSPASTRSGLPWIAPLLSLIEKMDAAKFPLFGACFGHQAIALALGGAVDKNPNGWVHGLIPNQSKRALPWTKQLADRFNLYGSHSEYVARLPAKAQESATSTGPDMGPNKSLTAGFHIGTHIWTSQHHPEMSHDFITALTDEMQNDLGPTLYAQAKNSLTQQADQAAFAASLAQFFNQSQL